MSESRAEYMRAYRQNEMGKQAVIRYETSEKGRERQRRYHASERGKKYRSSEKGKAKKKRYRDKRRALIQDFIASFKTGPCQDCGGTFPPYCMDFHHVHGEKRFALAEQASRIRPIADIELEIAKCVVICANCHRIRHRDPKFSGTRAVT